MVTPLDSENIEKLSGLGSSNIVSDTDHDTGSTASGDALLLLLLLGLLG